jgi:hypothetical protein
MTTNFDHKCERQQSSSKIYKREKEKEKGKKK